MTEQEWLTCTDPEKMLNFLRGKATDRKLRLFAVACCRRIWHLLMDERSRNAVEVAERFSDGLSSQEERAVAERDAFFFEDFIASMEWYYNEGNELANPLGFSAAEAAVNTACIHAQDAAEFTARLVFEAISDQAARDHERSAQCQLLHDIFGDFFRQAVISPVWLLWNERIISKLAQAIYDDRAFDHLPILADALEEAGCDNADILNHCRQPGEHVRGCWVVDLLLNKS